MVYQALLLLWKFYSEGGVIFISASWARTSQGIVSQQIIWSIWWSHQTLWNLPRPKITWHSRTWQYTVTSFIGHIFHEIVTLLTRWTLRITRFKEVSIEHLQRVRVANRGCLLLRTPGPVQFMDLHLFYSWNHSLFNLLCFPILNYEYPSILLFSFAFITFLLIP